ncbi:DUF177 domain-containing protein [Candidatus Zixiibacteriota bacterium]
MVIDLTELEEGETSWSKQAGAEELGLAFPDYSFAEPVDVQLRISHGEKQYIIRGRLTTKADTQCVKCLKIFRLPVEEEIGWVVQIVDDPKLLGREEASEDYWFVEKGCVELKITDPVRETVLVGLPRDPVCRENCCGLCAQCGADLNHGSCGCTTKEIDSRWGPLKELLEKKESSSGT